MIEKTDPKRRLMQQQMSDLQTLFTDLIRREDISLLEIDIVKDKVLDFYSSLAAYREQHIEMARQAFEKKLEALAKDTPKPVIPERNTQPINTQATVSTTQATVHKEPITPQPATPPQPLPKQDISQPQHINTPVVDKKIVEEPIAQPQATTTPTPQRTVVSQPDLFSKAEDLNAKLGKMQSGTSVADKLQKQEALPLQQMIGVNDKFYFVNALFEGDVAAYQSMLKTLTHCKSRTEEQAQLTSLSASYAWEKDNPAMEKLLEVLDKRWGDKE